MTYPNESTHALSYQRYPGPDALARDKRLTIHHRQMMLRRWMHDVRAHLAEGRRPDDRTTGDEPELALLARINSALRQLRFH